KTFFHIKFKTLSIHCSVLCTLVFVISSLEPIRGSITVRRYCAN
uniref:Uncharacterized protein n=1 Tax=Ciona intestinalis TaxID=7719 RepID=H2XUT7_CIOIN